MSSSMFQMDLTTIISDIYIMKSTELDDCLFEEWPALIFHSCSHLTLCPLNNFNQVATEADVIRCQLSLRIKVCINICNIAQLNT